LRATQRLGKKKIFQGSLDYYKFLTINKRMKEKTQSLIFLVVLGVAGYFAYQYFIGPYLQDSTPATTFNMYFLPEKCQGPGENLKKSFARKDIAATFNSYANNFRRCLRDAGYTDSQIKEAYNGIKNSR
jgi:hypothetical protein